MPGHDRHIVVDDLDDPRLEVYRNQRDAWLRARHNPGRVAGGAGDGGLFMAEGSLVIRALLRSRFAVESVLGTAGRLRVIQEDLDRWAPNAPVYVVSAALMERIVGFDMHRGLLAAGQRGVALGPREVIESSRVLVIAEGLSNHDNVGGMFRAVSALVEGGGVLLSPGCCDPLYRKALRVSIGHALEVPFARLDPWPAGLGAVLEAGFRLLALSPAGSGSVRRLEIGRGERVAVLVGTEGDGLRKETLELIGERGELMSIPMRAGVDSLNVVVALGIALERVGAGLAGD